MRFAPGQRSYSVLSAVVGEGGGGVGWGGYFWENNVKVKSKNMECRTILIEVCDC